MQLTFKIINHGGLRSCKPLPRERTTQSATLWTINPVRHFSADFTQIIRRGSSGEQGTIISQWPSAKSKKLYCGAAICLPSSFISRGTPKMASPHTAI
jgi:hypothetical protein